MRFPVLSALFLSALLAETLAAAPLPQDRPETETAAPDSPLVIKTAFDDVASELTDGDLFESDGDLPELGDGEHYVLTLDGDAVMQIATARGAAPLIDIYARPEELMDLFAEQMAPARQRIQGVAVFMMGQAGVKVSEAVKAVRAALDLPLQIDVVKVSVQGDPDRPREGYAAAVEITPIEDTWLAGFVGALSQSEDGAPFVDRTGSVMTVAMGVEIEPMSVLEPILGFLGAFGAKSRADVAKYREFVRASFECSTGNVGVAWRAGGGGLQMLTELRDTERMGQLLADPDYQRWVELSAKSNPGVPAEFDPGAFEHRGVTVAKSTIAVDAPVSTPIFEDGEMDTFMALAGDYYVQCLLGAAEGDTKRMIDAVLDQRVERARLPGTALATVTMRVAELIDHVVGGMVPVGDLPRVVEAELGKAGRALTFHLRIDRE